MRERPAVVPVAVVIKKLPLLARHVFASVPAPLAQSLPAWSTVRVV